MRDELRVDGKSYDIYYRDVVECIRALFGDSDFDSELLLAPERHYEDASMNNHAYHDMNTGCWWWDTQV